MGIRLERAVQAASVPPVLDPDQQRVVDHAGGPLLVLAGPGTGKTTTLVEVVAARIDRGVDPERVLLLTFGRKAAAEIRERLARRLQSRVVPRVWTFHGWAYSLIHEASGQRPTMLSGPDQDSQLRDLLAGSLASETEGLEWPDNLRAAVGTRAFADQVRDLISRARERGLTPSDVRSSGVAAQRVDWRLVARIYQDYLDGMHRIGGGSLDYAALIDQACRLLGQESELLASVQGRYDTVIVDEYQDTDPSQVELLKSVTATAQELIAIGDPDQSIYGFRGSDVRGILRFPEVFPRLDGSPAPIAALQRSGRAGLRLLAASRAVGAPLQYSGTGRSAQSLVAHRALIPRDGLPDGEVEVVTHRSAIGEARWIADQLRTEHLRGTEWHDMAVIVRTSVAMGPIARVLAQGGVPLEIAGDELPLIEHAAVRTLLTALVCLTNAHRLREEAVELLRSPLVGADSAELRRLGRFLRRRDRALHLGERPPLGSNELIADAVVDPRNLLDVPHSIATPITRLSRLLDAARKALAGEGGVIDALWVLWDSSPWPQVLHRAAMANGNDARQADASLDAVIALFSTVSDLVDRRRVNDPESLIAMVERLQIPGDVRTERAMKGSSVRVMTAHRSKGLEWPVVVVAAVQEGTWPDLRTRGSILEPSRLVRDGMAPATTRAELLAEERRLFYVAVTRARRRLLVSAVDGGTGGDAPSRFLATLGVPITPLVGVRGSRPTRLPDLVAQLRRTMVGDESAALRERAGRQLAWLATQMDDAGHQLCPDADPRRWWGVDDLSACPEPLRPTGEPIDISGSSLRSLLECPLRWSFDHEVGASTVSATPALFGSVVHAVVEELSTGKTLPTPEAIQERIDLVWDNLPYEAKWESIRERSEAIKALNRFLAWQSDRADLRLVGAEVAFSVGVQAGEDEARLRGSMDRVDVASDGAVFVTDFKTSKGKASGAEVEVHPQLGVYQAAVRAGALDEVVAVDANRPGGASLVYLRIPVGKGDDSRPYVHTQGALGDLGTVDEQLGQAVSKIRSEQLEPTAGKQCTFCVFRRCCTAQAEGERVIT